MKQNTSKSGKKSTGELKDQAKNSADVIMKKNNVGQIMAKVVEGVDVEGVKGVEEIDVDVVDGDANVNANVVDRNAPSKPQQTKTLQKQQSPTAKKQLKPINVDLFPDLGPGGLGGLGGLGTEGTEGIGGIDLGITEIISENDSSTTNDYRTPGKYNQFPVQDTSIIIANIFEKNRLNDLIRFMKKRQCLNEANIILIYLFHIIQACGIITTTIAGGYNIKELIWVGISLNLIASLINIFEKTNNNLSIKLYKNIKDIKDNTYIDESILVEEDKQLNTSDRSQTMSNANKSFYNNVMGIGAGSGAGSGTGTGTVSGNQNEGITQNYMSPLKSPLSKMLKYKYPQ